MTGHLYTAAIARARAVPIADEILRRGIKLRRVGLELVGACPVCGDGGKGSRSNRFAVHLRKNAWLCRRCQRGGGVVDLVMHLDGVGFKEAVAVLAGGKCPTPVPQHTAMARPVLDCAADEERKRQRALQWWHDASPIGGTPAERYLVEIRKLVLPPDLSPRVLRFHPDCPFGEDGTRHPCLLALYRRIELPLFIPPDQPVEAEPRAVMRTALTVDGKKIGRMAYGPVRGAAIKLSDDADVTTGLVIGEGLETTLAGMMFGFAPAWALGSAGGIAKFPVLSGIEALTVLAETEDGGANERASRECFARWSAAGREVLRATSMIGGDANDALTMAVAGDEADPTEHGAIRRKRA
jgi:putative DNA primase/helicase